jgi:hypothetical protein
MVKKLMLVGCLALLSAGSAFAGDSPKDVDAAIKAGNYSLAEQDLRAALVAHPQSAKAHYILAQVLAHEGNLGDAKKEAGEAQRLDPKIGFTDPARFQKFQGELDRALAAPAQRATPASRAAVPAAFELPARQPAPQRSSIWPWIIGLLVVGGLVMMFMRRRREASFPANGGGFDQRGPGYAPPYGQPPYGQQTGGGGSGIGGAFVGGLAGGALGAAAVNMYENHERSEEAGRGELNQGGGGTAPASDPSGQAYDDVRNDPIDMGNGGDTWGGDSIDTGDGGDDNSW